MTAHPAEPLKFEIVFSLSLAEYSEKNSSFLGTTYPSIPRELNMAFQDYGITPPQFAIKGFDDTGVDNTYYIEYMNPYTKPPVKETIEFKFDQASDKTSMNNWLNAMDEAVNKVVGAYNSSEGKSAAP